MVGVCSVINNDLTLLTVITPVLNRVNISSSVRTSECGKYIKIIGFKCRNSVCRRSIIAKVINNTLSRMEKNFSKRFSFIAIISNTKNILGTRYKFGRGYRNDRAFRFVKRVSKCNNTAFSKAGSCSRGTNKVYVCAG